MARGVFGRFLADGTPYVSPSQCFTVLTCGHGWAEAYLNNLREKTSIAATFGSNLHSVIEEGLLAQRQGQPFTMDYLQHRARQNTVSYYTNPVNLARLEDRDDVHVPEMEIMAGRLVKDTWKWVTENQWEPLLVEEPIEVRFTANDEDVALFGIMDALLRTKDGKVYVVDWKYPKQRPKKLPKGGFEPKPQYVHACAEYVAGLRARGVHVDGIALVHTTRTNKPSFSVSWIDVTDKLLAWARNQTMQAITKIQGGNLVPEPLTAGWKCSPKYCDAFATCPGVQFLDDIRNDNPLEVTV